MRLTACCDDGNDPYAPYCLYSAATLRLYVHSLVVRQSCVGYVLCFRCWLRVGAKSMAM